MKGSVIDNTKKIVNRTIDLVKTGKVRSFEGEDISIDFDSICLHGDTKGAVDIAREIQESFKRNNIGIKSMSDILV